MPTDVRKLIFSNRELRMILPRFCKENGIQVPDSPMEAFDIIEPGSGKRVVSDTMPEGLKVVLRFTSSDPHSPFRVHLAQSQVLEALIGACREAKIPLPRKAQKFLQAKGDTIALTLGMNDEAVFMGGGNAD